MSQSSRLLLGLVLGLMASAAHLLLLHRAVFQTAGAGASDVGQRITRGFPIRLLAVSPLLFIAARLGLYACIGLLVSWLVGRFLLFCLYWTGRLGPAQYR